MNCFIRILLPAAALWCLLPNHARSQSADAPEIVRLSSRGPLEIGDVRVNANQVGRHEKYEISFQLTGDWDNPFDPAQIRVDALFIAPDGEELTVPAFFYQPYRAEEIVRPATPDQNARSVGVRRLEKTGDPLWMVRFTPVQTGEYRWQITAHNQGKTATTPQQSFTCRSFNTRHGFLRISRTNPFYFEFDDGTPFFGVAQGRQQGNTYPDVNTYDRFAHAGGNFNRLFLTNGLLNLGEMLPETPRADRGVGRIDLEGAWHLDRVLESGEALGIYHMLTLTNQWTFNNRWDQHAYNKKNGGPIDRPAEYWTDEAAQRYFENHLRYVVARWGYSVSVFSWDLWNEYTAMPGGLDLTRSVPWHKRMAGYLASADVFDHVIHTNDGYLNGSAETNALAEMEIISTNIYMVRNLAKVAEEWTKHHTGVYSKPYVLTEYGTGHNVGAVGGYAGMDPERRMVHNGLWSPMMSGSASTGMAWEWNWLDHEIFYTFIRAVSKFVQGIPFSQRSWKPVGIASFRYRDSHTYGPRYGDVLVEGWSGNFLMPEYTPEVFHLDKSGNVDHPASLNAVLSGAPGARGTSSVTFVAEYPVNGEFAVCISEIRGLEPTPQLKVTIDGREVLKELLLPRQMDHYHPLMHNQHFVLPVTKGKHTIRVENSGGGSFVSSFELRNYIPREGPDLEVRGLQSEDHILLWLKNQKYTLLHSMMGIAWSPQPEGVLELKEVPEGRWLAEWINTIAATTVRKELVESRNGRLVLNTPVVGESVAVRLRRI